MKEEHSLSSAQSLALISSMIQKARNQYSENGHLYLVWGWVVFICGLAQFILINVFQYEKHYLVWFATLGAFFYQVFYLVRNKRRTYVRTYTHDIIGYVWLVFVVLIFLQAVIFGFIMGVDYYKVMNPGLLALYGMPTFLTGAIIRFRPLMIGAVGCWLLAIGVAFAPAHYQPAFLSAAVLVAWIIPGYLLRQRFKQGEQAELPTKLA